MGFEFDMSALMARFEEMEKAAKKDMSKKALDKGADIILNAQKETVPVDTGELKESLDKGNFKNGANASIEIGSQSADDDIIKRAFYNEYGTSNMVGKKWMKSAWTESIEEASNVIKESIKEDLGF